MSSRRRILASRRNGRKSRGPVTPSGKACSSRNATRHGLLARCCVLESESRECFDDLARQHFARFRPVDEVEYGLVEEMISASWRLRRCWALETRTLDHEIAAQVEGDQLDRIAAGLNNAAATHPLALMHRYETRLQMMYNRALNALLFLRTVCPAPNDFPNEPNPTTEHGHVIDVVGQALPPANPAPPSPSPGLAPSGHPSPAPDSLTPDPRPLIPASEASPSSPTPPPAPRHC